MIALTLQNLIHLVRSKLLLLVVVFSFGVQYLIVKLVKSATLYFTYSVQQEVHGIGVNETYYVAILASAFTGAFLAVVYGIWVAPFSHRGSRSALTHVLPVSRWAFPAAHALAFSVLILIHGLSLVIALGSNLGWSTIFTSEVPWKGMLLGFFAEVFVFYTVLFGSAVASMTLGAMPAFMMSYFILGFLAAGKAVLFFQNAIPGMADPEAVPTTGGFRWWFEKLPPMGDLPLDLRKTFESGALATEHLALWAIWLAAFVVWFRWKLRFPQRVRSAEA